MQKALAAGDRERLKLVTIIDILDQVIDRSPQQALQVLDVAEERARRLNEPCWLLFYQQLRAELHLFYLVDMKAGLDVAARALVEARKPEYQHCPTISGVMSALINAYVYIDPIGYYQHIIDAIDLIENTMQPDPIQYLELELKRALIEAAGGNIPHARKVAFACLAAVPNDGILLLDAYTALCEVMRMGRDYETGLRYAQLGTEKSGNGPRRNVRRIMSQFWGYHALFAHHTGDAHTADHYYKLALRADQLLQVEPFYTVSALLADYRTACADYVSARQLLAKTIAGTQAAGSLYAECVARAKHCRVLGLLGELTTADVQAARDATKHLIAPQRVLAYLDHLEAGDYKEWT